MNEFCDVKYLFKDFLFKTMEIELFAFTNCILVVGFNALSIHSEKGIRISKELFQPAFLVTP